MPGERALEYAKRAGLNKYYLPVVEVEIGGTTFLVYGSMSWTVAEVRSKGWEELKPAYVDITGDTREDPNIDAVRNVVSGELQKHWAKYHKRDDLMPSIEEQQRKRIEFALQDPPAAPAGPTARSRRTSSGSSTMSDGEKKVPKKGASGYAAELIAAGNHNKDDVTKKVTEKFPDVKNVAPAVSYAARCLDVTLT